MEMSIIIVLMLLAFSLLGIIIILICVGEILDRLSTLQQQGAKLMKEIDDLKAAIADELAAISEGQATETRLLTDVDQAVQKILTPGADPAEVEAAAQQVTAATAQLRTLNDATNAAAAKIEAALNPPVVAK